MRRFFLLLFITVNLFYLAGQTIIRPIKPSDTNPLITTFVADSHYVYINNNVAPQNILVVHLPGSFGEPKRATLFGSLAADLGFHSIGLMYPNIPTVGSFCSNATDPDCFENVRREIIEGADYSTNLTIISTESILSRTKKLIEYLNTNYPAENWGQYLDANNELVFQKIIFSGHSQGGGHATVIAKFYPIKRAICFSSPKDWRNQTNSPPVWLSSGNWQTPKSAIYCFNHVLDEHTNHQLEIWDSLGLNDFGTPINVDFSPNPYNHTRQLTTAFNVTAGDEHACTIQDNKTPKIANSPVFIPVWTYMLTDQLAAIPQTQNIFEQSQIIYPNPTSGMIHLNVTENNSLIDVYDQTGQKVMEKHADIGSFALDLSPLKTGYYTIQMKNNSNVFTAKIIKH